MRWLAGLALAAGVLSPAPALACRLALALALDISSSVDVREDRLQREGLAGALLADEVQAAFLSEPGHPVALAVYEWSGRYNQVLILDWMMIDSADDLANAAAIVGTSQRSFREFPTAIGQALVYASELFQRAPRCERKTVDISSDGENNESFPPFNAYRHFPLDDVTVNALAIGGSKGLEYMVDYYEREVIRGPGAFVERARGYSDFERAMAKKLKREVSARVIGSLDVAR